MKRKSSIRPRTARLAALALAAACISIADAQDEPPAAASPADKAAAALGLGDLFSAGVTAYEAGRFDQAAARFEDIVEAGRLAPEVFYNLGNAYYRLGESGAAALAYRRALALDPHHSESRQNLRYLRKVNGFLEFEGGPSDWARSLMTMRGWTITLVAAAWITALGAAAAFAFPRLRGAAIRSAIAAAAVIAAVAGAVVAIYRADEHQPDRLAVVTDSSVRALSAPASNAPSVISLPPGSTARPVESRGDWKYLEIPGGSRGWVPASRVEPLWPYDPGFIN